MRRQLEDENFEGVDIDVCEKCGALARLGELEQLTKRESGWFSRLLQRG